MAPSALARRTPSRAAAKTRPKASYDVLLVAGSGPEELLESGVDKRRAGSVRRALRREVPDGVRVVVRPAGTGGLARADVVAALDRAKPLIRAVGQFHRTFAAPTYEAGRAAQPALGPLTRALIGALADSPQVKSAADGILKEIADLITGGTAPEPSRR